MRHSVLVVTYNQEALIRDCLNSILYQTQPPFEIIISDDCSVDRTYDILLEYQYRYPDLVKVYRNKKNVGIFENINGVFERATGDMVHLVAGDDMIYRNMLETQSRFVEESGLNPRDKFLLITNVLKLNGPERVTINNFRYRNKSLLKSELRGLVKFWDNGYSIGLVKSMPKFRTDLGNHADLLQHVGRDIVCKNVYFINDIGYIYRVNAGITNRTAHKLQVQSYRNVLKVILKEYSNSLENDDITYIKMVISFQEYLLEANLKNYIRFLGSWIKSFPISLDSDYWNPKLFIPLSIKNSLKLIFRR